MAALIPRNLTLMLLLSLGLSSTSRAQLGGSGEGSASMLSATMAVLEQMTRSAGVIFAGEVILVQRQTAYSGSGPDGEGIVIIQFRVNDAVRGCADGSVYTVREWAGPWTSGERYHVGQRLLLFLHTPGAGGLSSPVHGLAGVISLRGSGTAPGPYDGSALAGAWLANLRWVEAEGFRASLPTQVSLPVQEPVRPFRPLPSNPSPNATEERVVLAAEATEVVRAGGVPPQWTAISALNEGFTQPLAQLLSLCREWVRISDGAQ